MHTMGSIHQNVWATEMCRKCVSNVETRIKIEPNEMMWSEGKMFAILQVSSSVLPMLNMHRTLLLANISRTINYLMFVTL